MKQWTTLMDGVENLHIQDVDEPIGLADDEVLVKISRVSLNYRDIQLITGAFKGRYTTPSTPVVPCSDVSGTIVRMVATASTRWNVGNRVFSLVRPNHLTGPALLEHHAAGTTSSIGIPRPGVLAEYRVFPLSDAVEFMKKGQNFGKVVVKVD